MLRVLIALILALSFVSSAYSAISISTDHRSLFFGPMQLGEEKELAQLGAYHNQITCSSTNGNAWYLKISLLQPLTSGAEVIPFEYFKWQLVWTNGNGRITNPYRFKEFSMAPDIVYASSVNEAGGNPVNFQLKYSLKIPDVQASGVYNTIIRFTLTEAL